MNKLILTLAITFGMMTLTATYSYAGQKDNKGKIRTSLVKKLNTLVKKDAEDLLHLENWMKKVENFAVYEVVEERALAVEDWMIGANQFRTNNEQEIALESWMLGERFTELPIYSSEKESEIELENWMFEF